MKMGGVIACIIGIGVGYLIYKDNKEEINNHIKRYVDKRKGEKMMKENNFGYYAGNDKEKQFDDDIRNTIKSGGDKDHMAIYVQQQEILNQLRRMRDKETNNFKFTAGPEIVYSGKPVYKVEPYGYVVPDGYMGRLEDGKFMLFATEGDYKEYIAS